MKNLIYLTAFITLFLSSCGMFEKEEKSDEATAPTTYASSMSGTTASGSLTVGSGTLSGTYATPCVTSWSSTSNPPSDAKGIGFVLIVTGTSSFTWETNYYTNTSCTTLSGGMFTNYTSATVGDASGSDYKISYTQSSIGLLVETTTAETWLEALFSNSVDLTVGTKFTYSNDQTRYNLVKVSGSTLYWGDDSSSAYPSSSGEYTLTKQ